MPRLIHPVAGTVVRCEGSLAAHFLSVGWTDADAKVEPVKVTPDKPPSTRRRPKS